VPCARIVGAARRLVYRQELDVYDRELDEIEAGALVSVAGGTTVGALCELLGDAQAAFGYITRWLTDGLLRS
jgi:hypothetical protein